MSKFTENELLKIKKLQELYADIIQKMGQLELQIVDIEKILNDLKNDKSESLVKYQNAKKMEEDLVHELTEKYGEGSIDINTGDFTPSNPK